ncbi:MAG TPA: VWA domain-containing protein [Luteimonas sp.]|nr:VWA domain-containing protein [Luteimonas sp.]
MIAVASDWISSLFAGFAWPWMLLALPAPWLARWLLPPVRQELPALRVPWGRRLEHITLRGDARGVRRMPLLAWLAWTLLCVAAARPQQLGEPVQPPASGRDLMLAVDLSGSMGEEDMRLGGRVVDRLTAAKAVIADFLDRRVGDRVGLIVFGQRAYALAPLTLDRDSVRAQLFDSVVGLAGRETAIGDAIGLAVKRLRGQEGGQRVLVLLTDGVNTAGRIDPMKAAELARDNDVRIHTIAFGGDGERVSMFGIQLPGREAEIDEAALQRIADTTGGRAFRARDADELAGIYAQIDRIEPVARPEQAVRPRIERYPWPLAAALLVGLLAMLPLPRLVLRRARTGDEVQA